MFRKPRKEHCSTGKVSCVSSCSSMFTEHYHCTQGSDIVIVIGRTLHCFITCCTMVVQGHCFITRCTMVVQGHCFITRCTMVVQRHCFITCCTMVVQGHCFITHCTMVVQGHCFITCCTMVVQGHCFITRCTHRGSNRQTTSENSDVANSYLANTGR